ncbi:hypothetical protein A8C32_17830 [Flavivirga aquatica]|uniref:Uncharacterized protein n=1 Tax=Flavivirga aquatica TaxID=1849968 RepID=A0A1E5T7E2_9FLAO|nr:hypothetical protein [Flavivirga aquatica]OEK07299.1 hypothetical protein A8C32_17830 [Flavivirga aquatica]
MNVKFDVEKAFKLSFDNIFVISGNVKKGEIKKGMKINVENNFYKICSIEYLDFKNGESSVGLNLKYKNSNELKQLNDFFSTQKEISILE